jgi:glycosyltransferase involved in cell wall biosynthesis
VYELPEFVALHVKRLLFEMAVLPWLLKLWKSDAVLMCGNVGMPFCPTRQVVVQHASFAAGASATRLQRVKWSILRWVATHTARTADAVVYVSASLRDELVQLGFPPGTIIRHGVNAVFHPMPADVARENVRRSFAIEPPFLLCVADIYAHKNLGLAIDVLARLHAEKHSQLLLVVAGSVRDAQEYERLRRAA